MRLGLQAIMGFAELLGEALQYDMSAFSSCLFNPHFIDAGEESCGLEAKEFGRPVDVLEIAAGLFQLQFNILPFTKLYVLFGEDLLSYEASTLG